MLHSTALTLKPGRGSYPSDGFHACRNCSTYLVRDAVALALFRRLNWPQPPWSLYLGQQLEPAK